MEETKKEWEQTQTKNVSMHYNLFKNKRNKHKQNKARFFRRKEPISKLLSAKLNP